MRDGHLGQREVVALSIDYDGCGDVHNRHEHPDVSLDGGADWPRVRPFAVLRPLPPSKHVRRKRNQFWAAVRRACSGKRAPSLCMSGSARVVYQRPLTREQDGMAHTVVLDTALRKHGFPGIALEALQRRDGGQLTYSPYVVPWPSETEVVRSKMSIVREQMLLTRRLFPGAHVVFVFIDDLYAVRLADAIRRNGAGTVPPWCTLHLIHYESFDPETATPTSPPERVRDNVVLWSKT